MKYNWVGSESNPSYRIRDGVGLGIAVGVDPIGPPGFLDRLGNSYDTSWSYRISIPSGGQPIVPGDYTYDNGKLVVTVAGPSITVPVQQRIFNGIDTIRYFTDKFAFQPQTLNGLASGGFAYVAPEGYWFIVEHPKADSLQIWNMGLTLQLYADSSLAGVRSGDAFVYRWNKLTGDVEFVGGVYDGATHIILSNQKFDVVQDVDNATTSDTFFYFVGYDTAKVKIDRALSGLSVNASGDSVRLVFKASDNTQSVSASVRIFGYLPDSGMVDLLSVSLDKVSAANVDTMVSLGLLSEEMLKQGLFTAVWATDQYGSDRGRRDYYYVRCPYTFDTVAVVYKDLTERFQLVSLPYQLPSGEDDLLYVMKGLTGGVYDRNEIRLYKVDPAHRDRVKEFTPGAPGKDGVDADTAFKFRPGASFFMITHYNEKNTVPLNVLNASVPAVTLSNKGYLVLSAGREGWYLGSAPFLGDVYTTSIDRVSVRNGANLPYFSRIFVDPDNGWKQPTNYLLSGLDHAKGFAAYLYPGDSLIMPVLNENDLLNYVPAGGKTEAVKGFGLVATLVDGQGNLLDGYNEMSVSTGGTASLPDLPVLNKSGMELGISRGGRTFCLDRVKDDGLGKIWTMALANKNDKQQSGNYTVEFQGLEGLPIGWEAWVDDPERGYGTDLGKVGGVYGVYSQGNSVRSLRVLTGDRAFIKKHVVQTAPVAFKLGQNYPNPFNPVTTVQYTVPDFTKGRGIAETRLSVTLYDIRGRMVRGLKDDVAQPGYHKVLWDGHDNKGKAVASGAYILRLIVRDKGGKELYNKSMRMIMAK